MQWQKIEERFFVFLMIAATVTVIGGMLSIIAVVVLKGLPAMNLAMLTQTPQGGFYLGHGGGVLNAIVGSIYLAVGAVILAGVLSVPLVLYLNTYCRAGSRFARVVRFSLDILWGVPSIVYGAFGFTLMLFLGIRASLLGGIITVGFLIVPIMARAMDEAMRTVPQELLEASYALGANRFETAFGILVRQASPGLLTAVLIALGRGIGDAASVLFTAGFSDQIPTSLSQPSATLPLAIFFQLGSPIAAVQQRGFAAALILTVLILCISIVSRIAASRFTRNVVR